MNKGRRQELTKLKHKKRCAARSIDPKKNYQYKAQTKPCSCWLCSPYKYDRSIKHKNTSF